VNRLRTPFSPKTLKSVKNCQIQFIFVCEDGKNLCKNLRIQNMESLHRLLKQELTHKQFGRVSWNIFRLSFVKCFVGTQLWSAYMYVNPILRFICGPTLVVIILCSISPLLMQHRFVLNILSRTLSHTPYLSHNLHALLLVYVSILSFSTSPLLSIFCSLIIFISLRREVWMIYRKVSFLAVKCFGSTAAPSIFLCVVGPPYWRERRGDRRGRAWSRIIRPQ
jgi:hypothetical protein